MAVAAFTLLSISPIYALAVCFASLLVYLVIQSRRAQLDHIPGPFLARYTNAWRCYQAWRYNHYQVDINYQSKLIGVYGDVVRIGPETVLVLDPEAINTVLGFKERLEKVRSLPSSAWFCSQVLFNPPHSPYFSNGASTDPTADLDVLCPRALGTKPS